MATNSQDLAELLVEFEDAWWANNETSPEDFAGRCKTIEPVVVNRTLSRRRAELADELERICNEFSERWRVYRDKPKGKSPPQIKDVVHGDLQSAKRQRLFYELLLREIRFRNQVGRPPKSQFYRDEFPSEEYQKWITVAFDRNTQAFTWRFRVLDEEPMAKGGQAEILWGFDDQFDREVVIKRVLAAGTEVAEERLRREAKTLAVLTDANVPDVFALGFDSKSRLCLAETFLRSEQDRQLGKSLSTAITEYHSDGDSHVCNRSNGRFLRLLLKIVDAAVTVALAHEHPFKILHRDLSPKNIVIDHADRAFVVDWGLALWMEKSSVESKFGESLAEEMSRTSGGGGTPGYLSPEQATTSLDQLGPSTDVFGLGACLFQLITGYRLYDYTLEGRLLPRTSLVPATTTKELLERAQAYRRPPALKAAAQGCDPELFDVLRRALEKDPKRRYPTAREFAQSLSDWVLDQSSKHRSAATRFARRRRSVQRFFRRHLGLMFSVAMLAILCLAIAGGVWLRGIVVSRGDASAQFRIVMEIIDILEATPKPVALTDSVKANLARVRDQFEAFESKVEKTRSPIDFIPIFDSSEFPESLAISSTRLAKLCRDVGDLSQAKQILESRRPQPDQFLNARDLKAEMDFVLGTIAAESGDQRAAIGYFDQALMGLRRLNGHDYPTRNSRMAKVFGYRGDCWDVVATTLVGDVASQDDALEQARKDYDDSLTLRSAEVASAPTDPDAILQLSRAVSNLARHERFLGKAGKRRHVYVSLLHSLHAAILQQYLFALCRHDCSHALPTLATAQLDFADTLREIGNALLADNRPAAAGVLYSLSTMWLDRAFAKQPTIDSSLYVARNCIAQVDALMAMRDASSVLVWNLTGDGVEAIERARQVFDECRRFGVEERRFRKDEVRLEELAQLLEGTAREN